MNQNIKINITKVILFSWISLLQTIDVSSFNVDAITTYPLAPSPFSQKPAVINYIARVCIVEHTTAPLLSTRKDPKYELLPPHQIAWILLLHPQKLTREQQWILRKTFTLFSFSHDTVEAFITHYNNCTRRIQKRIERRLDGILK